MLSTNLLLVGFLHFLASNDWCHRGCSCFIVARLLAVCVRFFELPYNTGKAGVPRTA